MLSPGPPQALHRRAARLRPARGHSERPDPAGPRLRLGGAPGPGQSPPGPSGRRGAGRRGGGVRGASPPRGADTRRHPTSRVSAGAHAGAARRRAGPLPPSLGDCVSDGSVGCGFGGRVTPYQSRAPGPAAAGHCSSTKGQGAARRPLPLASLIEARPRHSPASESRAGSRGSAARRSSAAGALRPSTSRGPRPGPCLAHPTAGWRRYTRICGGGATWRSVLRAHLLAPPTQGGLLPLHSPCPRTPAQACPWRCSGLPNFPLESLAKRRVIARGRAASGLPSGKAQPKPTPASHQTTFHGLLRVTHMLTLLETTS